MWLSLIIALLTYLLSPKNTAAERQAALLNAAVAGGATYAVTEYTDWGKENLQPLDTKISNAILPTKTSGSTTTGGGGSLPTVPDGTKVTETGSIWDSLSGWVAPAVAGLGIGGLVAGIPGWALLALAGIVAYLILKD